MPSYTIDYKMTHLKFFRGILFAIVFFFAQNVFSQSVNEQIGKSLKLIEFGNPKQAVSDLQKIVSSNPKDANAHAALGIAYLGTDKIAEAEKEIALAYDIEHKSVLVRTSRGMLFGKQGNRQDAVKEFTQALKIDDKNVGTYLYLARFYLSVDSLKSAEVTLYRAQAVNDKDVRPFIGLAELYEKQRARPLAITQYEEAKKIDPSDVSVLAKLAGLYYRERKYDESINEWLKLTKIDSSYSRAYYEIAIIFFKSRQYANAATYAEKYIALEPNDVDGIWLAAQALSESNQYQKALPFLEKAAKDDSLKNYTQLYLGRGYFYSKEFAKADNIFAQSKNLNPYDLYYYGYSLISLGDTVQGLEKWKQSLVGDTVRTKEEQTKVVQQIISFQVSQKKFADAGKTYIDLTSIQNTPENFVRAGQYYAFANKFEDAKSAFQQALKLDPRYGNAYIGLADISMQYEATLSEAEKSLEQGASFATSLESKDGVGAGYARLGIQYYKFKKYDISISFLGPNGALKYLSPSSPYLINVYKVTAAAYLQLKDFSKSEEFYKKALSINPKDEDSKKGLDFIKQAKPKK